MVVPRLLSEQIEEQGVGENNIYIVFDAVFISFYINLCFFVAEIGMLTYGPTGRVRHTLDTMAHVMAGPFAFIGFLNQGFMGTLFFFLSLASELGVSTRIVALTLHTCGSLSLGLVLTWWAGDRVAPEQWHFMCDVGRARPSYIRECPQTVEEGWVWFESLWLLIHHWYIGAFKLLSSDLASELSGIDVRGGPLRRYIRLWACGATLSHLSFGMAELGMRGHVTFRAISVLLRMGFAGWIAIEFPGEVRLAYIWDLCWMSVILGLTARKALCAPKLAAGAELNKGASPSHETTEPAPVHQNAVRNSKYESELALESRLVNRLRQQTGGAPHMARVGIEAA